MVDQGLLQKLHDEGVIDKRHVLWWQLGYEGRRVLSEDEFSEGLTRVSYEVSFDWTRRPVSPHEESFDLWTRDEVPILTRKVELCGESADCFVSVKPMSHPDTGGDGWRSLEVHKEFGFSPTAFHSPHIRGLVLEQTPDFLFWHPFIVGGEPEYYGTYRLVLKDLDLPVLICPIHPTKFYRNLIKGAWNKGKRPQKKPNEFDTRGEGFELVPYHEFDYRRNHLTVYPVSVFDGRLDLPGIILGGRNSGPSILGVGQVEFRDNFVQYWELSHVQHRNAKSSLIKRLGRVKRD